MKRPLRRLPKRRVQPRMITTRLPKDLHVRLIREAKEHAVSLNVLCLAKLDQPIDAVAIDSFTESEIFWQPAEATNG